VSLFHLQIEILIEAAHLGYFEFRLCPLATPNEVETNGCFSSSSPLFLPDVGGYQYPLGDRTGTYFIVAASQERRVK